MVGRIAIFIVVIAAIVWVNNSSIFLTSDQDAEPRLLSHRGVHQIYAGDVVLNDTCTANPVRTIRHSFVENTLPSMRAAFDAGADIVEIDVHLTPDKVFAVFHDWTLDCRTNGMGQTNQTPFSDLQALDAAYGYTSDGENYPLRGTGIGLIPSLSEVFEAFPNGKFLINFKSNRRSEGQAFADLINSASYREQVFGVYGGTKPVRAAIDAIIGLRGLDRSSIKSCLLRYEAWGWTGYVPKACRNQILAIPINYASLLWGWPLRFQERMSRHNTDILLIGPYNGDGHTTGIDTPQLYSTVPVSFSGYVWTNEIDQVEGWQDP